MARKGERKVDVAERRGKALELRKQGMSYQQVADSLGLPSRHAARMDVERALADVVTEPATELLQIELDRLDAMTYGLWGKASMGDEKAAETMLKVMQHRARLQGLYAAERAGTDASGMDAQRSMIGQLAAQLQAHADTDGTSDDE